MAFPTPAERIPLARLRILILRQSLTQRVKAVLHIATTFPFRQLVRQAHFGGPAVGGRPVRRSFDLAHERAHLARLQGVMMHALREFYQKDVSWKILREREP